MPAALTYPGVYIEEILSGVHTITGVVTESRLAHGPVIYRACQPDAAARQSGRLR
jgi:hypothetical protein